MNSKRSFVLLYIGSLVRDKDLTYGSSLAGNKMQKGIVSELSNYMKDKLDAISLFPLACFPKTKKVIINQRTVTFSKFLKVQYCFMINIFFAKQLTQALSLSFLVLQWILKNKNKPKAIIMFNSFPEYALPVYIVAKVFSIKNFCYLADLPIDVIDYSIIKQLFRDLQVIFTKIIIKRFTGLVVLNKNASKKYAEKVPSIQIDCGYSKNDSFFIQSVGHNENFSQDTNKVCVYCGTLIEYNGIDMLINSMKYYGDPTFRLVLYGDGPMKNDVVLASKNDTRILYKGVIANENIMKELKCASVLINPRPSKDLISFVTFPSKIAEYMLSGIPILTTKIDSLVNEYSEYVFFIEDETPQGIAKSLDCFFNIPIEKRYEVSQKAREYIINNKDWGKNVDYLLEFIQRLI